MLKKVLHRFLDNYPYIANKFAIYGTGKYATLLGDAYNDYIDCFIDENKAGEYFMFKPIISAKNLAERNVSALVIAASVSNEIIIYNRIQDLCKKFGIDVYSIHIGLITNKMGVDYSEHTDIHLMESRKYQEVIVDWEDTILYRGGYGENDFFRLLETRVKEVGNLALIRQSVEMRLKEKGDKYCLDDVYREMLIYNSIDENIINLIKMKEEELLLNLYETDEFFVDLLDRICKENTQLVICNSSIYRNELVSNLIRNTSKFKISNISIISSDEMVEKIVNEEFDVERERKLYITNRHYVNIAKWRLLGNDVWIKEYDDTYFKKFIKGLYCINSRSLLSLAYKKMFRKFFYKNHMEFNNIYDVAYLCIAPLITAYTIWLAKQVSAEKYDAVLFAARDGFLIKKLYDYIRKDKENELPPSIYFYASRKACMKSGLFDENDLVVMGNLTGKSAQELMSALYDNCSAIYNTETFLELSSTSRKNYCLYMDNIGVDYRCGKYAFCDLISGGTSQYYIQKLFTKTLTGFYVSYHVTGIGVLKTESLYPSMSGEEVFSDDLKNFLESVLTSTESSLVGFDDIGNPILSANWPSEEKKGYITSAQKAITDFFRNYYDYYYCVNSGEIEYMMLISWIEYIKEKYSFSKKALKDVDLFEDLWKKSIKISL